MVIYDRYDIVFQELPNQVTLAFTLKNCPNKCQGCHSEHLRQSTGNILTETDFIDIITKYKNQVTAILFLGGDADHDGLIPLIKIARKEGFKTGLYSGLNEFKLDLMEILDYYKAGKYIESLGGLDSETTNQKMIKISEDKIEDITYMFWR